MTLVARARARFPRVELPDEVFARWVEERTSDATTALAFGEDLWLACACAHGDEHAIRHLEHQYRGQIAGALARALVPSTEQEETVQRVMSDLLLPRAGASPKIAGYRGVGPLGAWLRVVALRSARRASRVSAREVELDFTRHDLCIVIDPEAIHLKESWRATLKLAFADAVSQVAAKERNLLRLSLLDGLSIDQLAAIYHVHRSTVARSLSELRARLAADTRARLRERLGLTEEELLNLAPAFSSQLDLSLSRVLGRPRSP